jgi:hypothetical protein
LLKFAAEAGKSWQGVREEGGFGYSWSMPPENSHEQAHETKSGKARDCYVQAVQGDANELEVADGSNDHGVGMKKHNMARTGDT